MAIRRLDPSARFKIICEYDDALIRETEEELKALEQPSGETLPTRYEEYLENLDQSKLRLKPDGKPTYFHFRCLTNLEQGELQEKFMDYDVKEKRSFFKGSKTRYFVELFEKGVIGIEDETGAMVKIDAEQIGMGVVMAIALAINSYTAMGKHLKK